MHVEDKSNSWEHFTGIRNVVGESLQNSKSSSSSIDCEVPLTLLSEAQSIVALRVKVDCESNAIPVPFITLPPVQCTALGLPGERCDNALEIMRDIMR